MSRFEIIKDMLGIFFISAGVSISVFAMALMGITEKDKELIEKLKDQVYEFENKEIEELRARARDLKE